jgi:putative peptide zinc metalloprotease protein
MEADNLPGLMSRDLQPSEPIAPDKDSAPAPAAERYFVIPLSVQKDGAFHIVGNADIGEFYQFPEQGVAIVEMLRSGHTATAIKSRLAADSPDLVDVDDFLDQLTEIGFIYPENQKQTAQERLAVSARASRTTFDVRPGLARSIFSLPVLACYFVVVAYAGFAAIRNPELRLNPNAFYIESLFG